MVKSNIVHGGTEDSTTIKRYGRKNKDGAYCDYEIHPNDDPMADSCICFQDAPVADSTCGCSDQDLLAIVIDRLKCFQEGKAACKQNVSALIHLGRALRCLNLRDAKK